MDCKNQLEHLSLRWNNYNDNMKTGFHDLLKREDFVDVTIAVEGKIIQAHKMVLSICSPYFKNIFKANPCQHPIVFLKDVTHKELTGILQFMYLGEVSVQQEELGRFLKTAEALQIKGLTSEDSESRIISSDDDILKQSEELTQCSVSNKDKSKMISYDIPENPEVKKMKMGSSNGLTRVRLGQLPDPGRSEDSMISNGEHYAKLLTNNESPELDFYDIECDRVSIKEESIGIGEDQLQDSVSEASDEIINSHSTRNKLGSGNDLNNMRILTEDYKREEGNQGLGSKISPALTKNQGLCPICGRILQHKKNLQTHIIDQHSGIFRCWPCQICHKVCRTWSALRVHNNRHHMKLDPSTGPRAYVGVTQQGS